MPIVLRVLSRINCRIKFAAWRQPRAILWATAGVVTLGFLIALEIAARRYTGEPGPITDQAREVIFAPKPGPLYGGMALMMVVLTWRQRFIALGAAIGIDIVFVLVR
ncbi:DUF5933 domain-containing protein, partial [Streptomyces sp. 2MCAF27]